MIVVVVVIVVVMVVMVVVVMVLVWGGGGGGGGIYSSNYYSPISISKHYCTPQTTISYLHLTTSYYRSNVIIHTALMQPSDLPPHPALIPLKSNLALDDPLTSSPSLIITLV